MKPVTDMKKITLLLLLVLMPTVALADDATTTPATTTPDTVTVTVRDGATIAYSGTATLPDAGASPVFVTPNSGTTSPVAIPARSVLSVLESVDAAQDSFTISDLQYFSSFNSFLINCVTIPSDSVSPLCADWQYVVNGAAPPVGVDQTTLQNSDVVILYFGFPRQVSLSTSTAVLGTAFTATAQTYNPSDNTYSPATGVTIGVTQTNPDDPYTPLEIATSTVDSDGQAIFTLSATGTFAVGIKEDYYFPTTPLTITDPPPVEPPPATAEGNGPPVSSGGGGGGGGSTHVQLNPQSALAYLTGKQHADGSFDSPLLTDWAALAYAAGDTNTARTNLRNYLLTANPSLSSVTDYERHAMALMALGINPYTGTPVNFIAHITDAFDGTQIGDAALDNDDIFSLFPLLHAGYGTGDEIVQKTVAFIVSRQQPNGAWDSSVDVTAAAIQALSQTPSLPGVSAALSKAAGYLRSQQQSNGGWGNSFSTSWALQAIAALNESAANWAPAGHNPNDYLAGLQQTDGGIEPTASDEGTRVWASSYAIPGSLGKTWDSLLSSFSKPSASSGSGIVLGTSTSTISVATSTPELATTISIVATSTPEMIATSTPVVGNETAMTLSTSSVEAATTTPAKPKPKIAKVLQPKKVVGLPLATTTSSTPPATANQTSAAATASPSKGGLPGQGFLSGLWRSIASFFARLF